MAYTTIPASSSGGAGLLAANNLSDVASVSAAVTNLGLQPSSAVAITGGTIAGITAFNVAGTALYYDAATQFIGIGTTSTDLNGSGGAGLTIKGPGAGAVIELQRTVAASTTNAGKICVFNGVSPTHEVDFAIDDGTVNSGKYIFYTLNGGVFTQTLTLRAKGNVQVGLSAPATTATDGFPYIPACAGTPTGVPTAITGYVPMAYDSTNNKFYIYNGGWKGGTVPGVFA